MYGGSGWTDTPMPLCHIVCFCVFDRGSGSKMPDFWRNVWRHKEVINSNTEVLKGHLSLTWKSVFVLLKIGICFRKSELVLQNGGFVFKNVVERFNYCIVKLLLSNSRLRQTPWFTNADFWKQTPIFQTPSFKNKLRFSNSDFRKKVAIYNSNFWNQSPIFKLRVSKNSNLWKQKKQRFSSQT